LSFIFYHVTLQTQMHLSLLSYYIFLYLLLRVSLLFFFSLQVCEWPLFVMVMWSITSVTPFCYDYGYAVSHSLNPRFSDTTDGFIYILRLMGYGHNLWCTDTSTWVTYPCPTRIVSDPLPILINEVSNL